MCVPIDSIIIYQGKVEVRVDNLFDIPSLNVIWRIASGQRFDYNDKSSRQMIDNIESFTMEKCLGPMSGVSYMKYLPPFNRIFANLAHRMDLVKSFFQHYIGKLKDSTDDTGYIEAFVTEQANRKMANGNANGEFFTEEQLVVSLIDFFTGGSGTMSKTLAFAILFMLHNPDVQDKLRAEVDALGVDDFDLSMRDRIPYTEAFLCEVQRLGSVLPICPPRLVKKDVNVGGYLIKSGTKVQVNLYGLHRDQGHWKDPYNFRPERFLSDERDFTPDDWLQPFGYGKYINIYFNRVRVIT